MEPVRIKKALDVYSILLSVFRRTATRNWKGVKLAAWSEVQRHDSKDEN